MTVLKAEVVLSPCMSICALDEQNVCIGCGRTGMEVSYWGRFNNEQKRQVLAHASLRRNGKAIACVWQALQMAAKQGN